ncbi:hypothetical protein [Propionispira raffinosivorans]|uniref:hypothetical protein n=1 Tax=Propionispira raffinosivorans TaxID=86959 RepID=UPI000364DA88|nr:hypothetical protein [Propionispira raffinosivorans]
MSLSKQALRFLDFLAGHEGKLKEKEIREVLGVSHGTFIHARRELVDRQFLQYTSPGGNEPPTYKIIESAAPLSPTVKVGKVLPPAEVKSLMQEVDVMPEVSGEFFSYDDWVDALIGQLGDCVDVDCEDIGLYRVFSHTYQQAARYKRQENENGFSVYKC